MRRRTDKEDEEEEEDQQSDSDEEENSSAEETGSEKEEAAVGEKREQNGEAGISVSVGDSAPAKEAGSTEERNVESPTKKKPRTREVCFLLYVLFTRFFSITTKKLKKTLTSGRLR